MKQDIDQKTKKMEQMVTKSGEIEVESASTQKKIDEMTSYKKELEDREVKLNGEYKLLMEKRNSGT